MNTWAEIKAAFEGLVGDSNQVFFDDEWQVRIANRGLEEICRNALYKDDQEVANVVSGTARYVADNGYGVTRVEYDGTILFPITKNDTRSGYRNWQDTITGVPKYYFLDESANTSDSYSLSVTLHPEPSASLTNGLRTWIYGLPTAVSDSSPSAEIDVPHWASGAVLFFMLKTAFEAETTLQNMTTSEMYGMLYRDVVDRLCDRTNSRLNRRWTSGGRSRPTVSVLNRLPVRIPAP